MLDTKAIGLLIVLIVLILVNAFFAASEMAIVSIKRVRLETLASQGNKKAKAVLKVLDDPNNFLSTIQVAITLAGFLSSAIAAAYLESPLSQLLIGYGLSSNGATTLAIVIITIILSYFSLVFGELIPKRIALQKSETVAFKSIYVIVFVSKITSLFVKLLSVSTNFFMRILKIDTNTIEEKVTEEEINKLLEIGTKHGLINESGKEMIESIFLFDDKLAKEVMTPRTNIFCIDIEKSFPDVAKEFFEVNYSRVPVYQGEIDNIIGVLHLKDLIRKAYDVGFENVKIKDILQEAYFVSEHKKIDVLFKELQANQKHMAFLIDEYGVLSGIVTIEDLIEEIVGEIEDEFDEYNDIIKVDENQYLVKGYVSIADLNHTLDLNLDETNPNYDTVAGLIIEHLEDLPNHLKDTTVVVDSIIFKPNKIVDKRIEEVKITLKRD